MMKVLVTGANGSIGKAIIDELLYQRGFDVIGVDIGDADITQIEEVKALHYKFGEFDCVLHLAGAKHAPECEQNPEDALFVNGVGTHNLLQVFNNSDTRFITASTCKSVEPETAYGASKLLAERLTLAAGGSVARFHNVIETQGNVFDIWDRIPSTQPLPVAVDCVRHFIHLDDVLALLLFAIRHHETGRFFHIPSNPLTMREVAEKNYPHHTIKVIKPRRGDRVREPLIASHERKQRVAGETHIYKITSPYDPPKVGVW